MDAFRSGRLDGLLITSDGFPVFQEGVHYEGIGFYVTVDDGSLSLEDVRCQSGFRQAIETAKPFRLEADTPYLLIPMTYKKGVEMPYDIEVGALLEHADGRADGRAEGRAECPHCMLSALPHCMQVYCDQPSLRVEQLSKAAADARRAEQVLASDLL